MKDLQKQLKKLGSQQPKLRKHIIPVLEVLNQKTADSNLGKAIKGSAVAFERAMQEGDTSRMARVGAGLLLHMADAFAEEGADSIDDYLLEVSRNLNKMR